MKQPARSTDWGNYYRKPFAGTRFTRKVSERKIIDLFSKHRAQSNPRILELGGANSCFSDALIETQKPSIFNVADTNQYGLDLFKERYNDPTSINAFNANALNLPSEIGEYDIVFSVGLIEHFMHDETRLCIENHFKVCKDGGIVLITFPTPTFLYWLIRKPAEWMNAWKFYDERPLKFREVIDTCEQHGQLLHRSINWAIGLTQGYVVYRKS